MIVSVPSPPVLLPGLTGRPVPEVERLRSACLAAIADLLASAPDEILVVGASTPAWTHGTPLAQLIGHTLLAEAGWAAAIRPIPLEPDLARADCLALGRSLAGSALLVVADGSARRSMKAPGYLDERAAPFDAQILAALQAGDPSGLAALDPALAADLMVAGRAAWQVLAGAAEHGRWRAELHYADDPFGVFYPVVGWTEATPS